MKKIFFTDLILKEKKIAKALLRVALVILIILTAIFAGSYFYVKANGKRMMTEKLSRALGTKVDVGRVRVTYPMGLWIQDLKIEGYGSVKGIRIGFGLFNLWGNQYHFSSIVLDGPQINCHRTKDSKITLGELPAASGQAPGVEGALPADPAPVAGAAQIPEDPKAILSEESIPRILPAGQKPFSFSVKRLLVRSGTVRYYDYSFEGEVVQVVLRNIQLKASRFTLPLSPGKTYFELAAFLGGMKEQFQPGSVEGRGWADFFHKDMKAVVKISNFDGQYFAQYFTKNLNKRLKKILADLSADVESQKNELTVRGKLEVKGLIPKKEEGKEDRTFSPEDFILGTLESLAKEISLNFQFKTKMDDFKVESLSLSGQVMQ